MVMVTRAGFEVIGLIFVIFDRVVETLTAPENPKVPL